LSSASTIGAASPSLALLEARQLGDALKLLLQEEQAAMAKFLVALADLDRRRGWEALGHASLFTFLNVELGLSKGAAYVRSSASRLIRSFPEALAPLMDGRLCLSSVAELARVATPGNFTAVLSRFFGCSSREAREVAAAIAPREAPPLPDQVTRVFLSAPQQLKPLGAAAPTAELRLAPSPAAVAAALTLAARVDSESVRAHEPDLTQPARGVTSRDDIEPLTAELRRLHFTVSRQFLKDLETAKAGLSHAIPNATTEQVLQAALRLLLQEQARARGQVKRPRSTRTLRAARRTEDPANGAAPPQEALSRGATPQHVPPPLAFASPEPAGSPGCPPTSTVVGLAGVFLCTHHVAQAANHGLDTAGRKVTKGGKTTPPRPRPARTSSACRGG
jgi:hypothetical protein